MSHFICHVVFSYTKASLHDLEDNDLDALMADLVADISATEEKFATEREGPKETAPVPPPPVKSQSNYSLLTFTDTPKPATSSTSITAPPPPPSIKPSKVSAIFSVPNTHTGLQHISVEC